MSSLSLLLQEIEALEAIYADDLDIDAEERSQIEIIATSNPDSESLLPDQYEQLSSLSLRLKLRLTHSGASSGLGDLVLGLIIPGLYLTDKDAMPLVWVETVNFINSTCGNTNFEEGVVTSGERNFSHDELQNYIEEISERREGEESKKLFLNCENEISGRKSE